MTAPLIIHDQRDRADQQEVVVMLADFSFTPPEQIFAGLKKAGRWRAWRRAGPTPKPARCPAWRCRRQAPSAAPDLNDVKYDAFLANFRTLADPEVVKVEPGGRVLLRIINSASMSNFHIDLGGLEGDLIAVDGFEVAPIRDRRFPVAVAQRLDIRVTLPPGPGAYPVLALLEGERDQTGIVLRRRKRRRSPACPTQAETASPALTLDLESRLRALRPLSARKADRVHTLNLTGEMAGYVWSINNVVWNRASRRCRSRRASGSSWSFVNQTPMPHPMHLHGHEFQVVEIDGVRFAGAVRDTVLVLPGGKVVVAFDAEQSRLVGAPLPPALPPRRRHVHDHPLRLSRRHCPFA